MPIFGWDRFEEGGRSGALRWRLREVGPIRDARSAARALRRLTARVLHRLSRDLWHARLLWRAHLRRNLRFYPRLPRRVDPSARGANVRHAVAETLTEECSAAPALREPSFDIAVHNPVNWRRYVSRHVGALGPLEMLPVGSGATLTLPIEEDRVSIRLCHHLVDIGAFHGSPPRRAQTLVKLIAAGTPIHVLDREPELGRLLGPELHELAVGGDILGADAAGREQISVRMRRIALRDHSTYGCSGSGWPSVSVLLATRRPHLLQWAVANVARQNYPSLELVLGLHGPGFEQALVDRALEPLRFHATVIRVADPELQGATVLNAATAAADGELVAKMDDDDLYDEHHIWDLVLARAYSKADVVSKKPEALYLMLPEKTVRRQFGEGERYTAVVAGNSLLSSRRTVDEVDGFPRVVPEDYAFIRAVVGIGGSVYRTHGSGMIFVRHGDHGWQKDDDAFLAEAEEFRDGWQPSIAGFSSPVPPPPPVQPS